MTEPIKIPNVRLTFKNPLSPERPAPLATDVNISGTIKLNQVDMWKLQALIVGSRPL